MEVPKLGLWQKQGSSSAGTGVHGPDFFHCHCPSATVGCRLLSQPCCHTVVGKKSSKKSRLGESEKSDVPNLALIQVLQKILLCKQKTPTRTYPRVNGWGAETTSPHSWPPTVPGLTESLRNNRPDQSPQPSRCLFFGCRWNTFHCWLARIRPWGFSVVTPLEWGQSSALLIQTSCRLRPALLRRWCLIHTVRIPLATEVLKT